MGNREEALRSIFEATGVQGRLTDEQQRELLAHLEDAVEAKVAAGVPEMDAVGRAFGELGDLKKIAQGFPAAAPVVATVEGPILRPWTRGIAAHGFGLLLAFAFAQIVLTPLMLNLFLKVKVPMPRLTLLYWDLSDAMRQFWPVVAVTLAGLGLALLRIPRAGKGRIVLDLLVGIAGALLLGGLFLGVVLPFTTLLQGTFRR